MLRGFTARLSKHKKLCTKFYSLSHLQRTLPTIHRNNIRLIQSIVHNNPCQTIISPFNSFHHKQTYKSYCFNPLQIFNTRSFSLPEHDIMGLPALSPSVEESKIVAWKANEGDFVPADTAIASIQTDKAELDWMVTDDVYLAKILLQPGMQVPVGTPACIFVEDKAHIDAFKNYSADMSSSSTTDNTPPPTPTPASTPAIDTSHYPDHRVEGMPALSPTAVDGAVVEWLIKEGDMVSEGSGIAEIQTDKSVVTWTSTDDAYVAKLLVAASPDTKLTVGTPVAVFVDEKNDIAAFKDFIVAAASTAPKSDTPKETVTATAVPAPSPPADTPKASTSTTTPSQQSGGRIFASPYAKKLAQEMGIELNSIGSPTGDNQCIVAADVIKASQQKPTTATPSTSPPPPKPITITGDRSYEDIPVTVMREIIGQRLSESKFTSPHFYVTMECLMDSLIQIREEINAGEESKISVNDFVIKACAAALRDTPDCNVGWIVHNNKPIMRKYNYIDISVAVATPAGLITPIIKDADRKSLSEISYEMKYLARKAKDNKLLPEEFQGGTFTISNMGMFGVTNFTAIINPPQACILAVGATKQKLLPDDKNEKGFKTVSTMEVTLSSDHRSVDGALAAIWINAFQKYIEKPSKLMR